MSVDVSVFSCFVLRLFYFGLTVNAQGIFNFVLKVLFHPLISYGACFYGSYAQDIIYFVLKLPILME